MAEPEDVLEVLDAMVRGLKAVVGTPLEDESIRLIGETVSTITRSLSNVSRRGGEGAALDGRVVDFLVDYLSEKWAKVDHTEERASAHNATLWRSSSLEGDPRHLDDFWSRVEGALPFVVERTDEGDAVLARTYAAFETLKSCVFENHTELVYLSEIMHCALRHEKRLAVVELGQFLQTHRRTKE